MKFARITAAALAALMLLSTAACSDTPGDNSTGDTTAASSDTVSSETQSEMNDLDRRAAIDDGLPEKNFNGQEFRVLTSEEYEYEIKSEEMTGEVTNDAVYDRNVRIEDRFNCKITTVLNSAPYNEVKLTVSSGDDAYEIAGHYEYKAYVPISAGCYLNWNEIPHIDQSKPWWSTDSNAGSTINGKLFCIVGDLSISALKYTYAFFFNMPLLESYGYDSSTMYSTVREGKWTLDKLNSMVNEIYEDKNGNGEKDVGDTFSYGYWGYHGTDVWVTAMGEKITTYDKEANEIKVTLGTEKVYSALEKLINIVFNSKGGIRFKDETTGKGEFINGNVCLMPLLVNDCYGALRDMQDTYGILPFPKYDENQTNYYTNSMDQHTVFGIPKTVREENYEFLGIVMEALNAESYKTVYPAYYDTALKGKYSADPETAEMVDLIMAGRVYEFSFQFGEFCSNLPYMFRYQLYDGNPDLASKLASSSKVMAKQLGKVLNFYSDDFSG